MKITLISGTNREGSWTLRVTEALARRYEEAGCTVSVIDLRHLPADALAPTAYAHKPADLKPLIREVLDADGLVVVAPEYNGSFPGVLKLFIDLLPFPAAFDHRPVAFVGLAAGQWGGLRPVEQLQQVFGYRNAFVFPERMFLPAVHQELDPDTLRPKTELTASLLDAQIEGFVHFCEAVAPRAAKALHPDALESL